MAEAKDLAAAADGKDLPTLQAPRTILDMVNYQLYLIGAMNSSIVTRICEGEFGITRREWRFIALLAALGSLAPSELALRAGLDRSRTSKALMPLLSKGLIARQSLPNDRRRATVTLTPEGHALYGRLFPRVQVVNTDLMAVLDKQEVKALAILLNKLRARAAELIASDSPKASADRRHGGSQRKWESIATTREKDGLQSNRRPQRP